MVGAAEQITLTFHLRSVFQSTLDYRQKGTGGERESTHTRTHADKHAYTQNQPYNLWKMQVIDLTNRNNVNLAWHAFTFLTMPCGIWAPETT